MTQPDGPARHHPAARTRTGRGTGGGRPVPLYVVTGGRSAAGARRDPPALDLITLVVTRTSPVPPGTAPEAATVLRACRYPLSAAEISAHLRLPFGALTVLLADLAAEGHVELRQTRRAPSHGTAGTHGTGSTGSTAPDTDTAAETDIDTDTDTDIETLRALIDGLQRL